MESGVKQGMETYLGICSNYSRSPVGGKINVFQVQSIAINPVSSESECDLKLCKVRFSGFHVLLHTSLRRKLVVLSRRMTGMFLQMTSMLFFGCVFVLSYFKKYSNAVINGSLVKINIRRLLAIPTKITENEVLI